MSHPQYGKDMDRPSIAGSVKRARERAQAGFLREQNSPPGATRFPIVEEDPDSPTDVSERRQVGESPPSRIPRPQPPAALQNKDGGIGVAISRPTQIPQWPLPGPILSPANNPDAEPYRPPPGRGPPPQRPPRPSRVPSILDSSRVQDHTPVFQYTPQSGRESVLSQEISSTPLTPSSRHTQSSLSSVGSIPDFPLPAAIPPVAAPPPVAPPRRSVTLGPPPSSRRGDSSFYSNASFVSPIPEESPRSRSHTSFASSAAMPESWGSQSPGFSPGYPDDYYGDDAYSTEDENSQMSRGSGSPYGDVGDESKLVRSASLGKMSKPSIVMNRAPSSGDPLPQEAQSVSELQEPPPRPSPSPMQLPVSPFESGTAYYEGSSSSGTVPTVAATANTPSLTPDAMLGAFAAASATDPADMRKVTPSPRPYDRLSAIRRPPKLGLDMDSVRAMESRGSMTSLPDLIKRATRLAALIDRGRRPGSRFEIGDGTWPDEKAFGREGDQQVSGMSSAEKHQSGLSDMLAAFPPPAATTPNPPNRGSWFRRASTASWPLAPGSRGSTPQPVTRAMAARGSPLAILESNDEQSSTRPRRRCCGLPLWAFIVIVIIVLGIVAAAIVVPLEFLVFRRNRTSTPTAEPALNQCQNQLRCENGGTNVISQGVCSCICINGFTGQTCSVAGATGCTTTNLMGNSTSTNFSNVTLGQAVPRLLQQARTNFSVPLDGTDILAKFNTENLSCIAQNSLVTFDGRSSRVGTPTSAVDVVANAAIPVEVIVIPPGEAATVTIDINAPGAVVLPSPDIVGGFTTLTGPFRVTTIYATSSTKWATIPVISSPTSLPETTPPVSLPATTTAPSPPSPPTTMTTMTTTPQGPLFPSIPVPSAPAPNPRFMVTEETLDFARVSVLLILERQSLMAATTAQTVLQRFFTTADQGGRQQNGGVTPTQALNVTLGGGNSVDLVNFLITIPGGIQAGGTSR
ncbi:hypothetical protein CH63R_07489 [Colletotrichum higginsianum IMI 349063]|uniref:EGF-like domain-containing protein n=2 Tax=Colletotrichum higginsianum (strain IMI 349063) TaxID=759273 RepID=A0A1B7Y9R1_COLHI|nr:hypothetical protein CH63R_07489 [Colletotrichum higginsianum IMI 349063]OBR08724.1 hypothetical protein CH63R_07489 [Colletotrichum higginsianum IMI 349063]